MKVLKRATVTLLVLYFITSMVYMVYQYKANNLASLSKGTLVLTVPSPRNDRILRLYEIRNTGMLTSPYSIRGEVEFEDGTKKTIYYQDSTSASEGEWVNNYTVVINNIPLNIWGSSYQLRMRPEYNQR
ncbi:DUF5412 family protein [Gorillibacterium sp. sgz5001074]|uniref:DUF5412 family protein n=1 Tax=Gorillibacterium sp. sgz5001074 TaxID=3446695 RepID=UPI003F6649BD